MEKIVIVKDGNLIGVIDKPDKLLCYYLWQGKKCIGADIDPCVLMRRALEGNNEKESSRS